MSLGSDVAAALPFLRGESDSRRTETFEFFSVASVEPTGDDIDPTDVETVLYSSVRGRVKFPSMVVSDRQVAGQLVGVQSASVNVAVGATPNVREGHFCRVTASTADGSLVGRRFRVDGLPQAGQVTAHRYPVTEE